MTKSDTPINAPVLVTGANGFVGTAVCRALLERGRAVRAAVRGEAAREALHADFPSLACVSIGDLAPSTDWRAALAGCDSVVHLAGRVHVMNDTAADSLAASRRVNRDATRHLVESAARAGVRRFVFVSTIKVNGEATTGAGFNEHDVPAPEDPYAISKWEAEQAIAEVASAARMEFVVLRPPLVYGPRVGANFLRVLRAVDRGDPIALGSIQNRRSYLYVGNLADAIAACIEHPAAAGKTYVLSDGEDLSTPELFRRVGTALQRPARLTNVPVFVLRIGALLLGRGAEVSRVASDLVVDDSAIRRELDWRPRYTMQEGLAETTRWYRSLGESQR
jgi:UDP-N-acetyl-alpha-D-quinovosamine dehydrogenase